MDSPVRISQRKVETIFLLVDSTPILTGRRVKRKAARDKKLLSFAHLKMKKWAKGQPDQLAHHAGNSDSPDGSVRCIEIKQSRGPPVHGFVSDDY